MKEMLILMGFALNQEGGFFNRAAYSRGGGLHVLLIIVSGRSKYKDIA